jgi:hypothetical protein
VAQKFEVGSHERRFALAEDAEHFGSLHPYFVIGIVQEFRKQRQSREQHP